MEALGQSSQMRCQNDWLDILFYFLDAGIIPKRFVVTRPIKRSRRALSHHITDSRGWHGSDQSKGDEMLVGDQDAEIS